jgi:toxin YoeB
MGKYKITLTDLAKKQLKQHKKSGNQATIKRIEIILYELSQHPFEGTGKPEALKYNLKGFWSRRINLKDRMVYEVFENTVTVDVISAKGHYGDK